MIQSGDKWSYCNDFLRCWENPDCAVQEKTTLRCLDSLSTLGSYYRNFIFLQFEMHVMWLIIFLIWIILALGVYHYLKITPYFLYTLCLKSSLDHHYNICLSQMINYGSNYYCSPYWPQDSVPMSGWEWSPHSWSQRRPHSQLEAPRSLPHPTPGRTAA